MNDELEQKRADQKRMMSALKKEIDDLDRKVNPSTPRKVALAAVKNLKISARLAQYTAPFALTSAITLGALNIAGLGVPFVQDDFKHKLYYMNEYDKDGTIRTEQEYKRSSSSDEKSFLTYYGKWEQQENGTYSRVKRTYDLEKKKDEEINQLVNGELSIEEFLGKPKHNSIETKNILTEEEFNKEAQIIANVYGVNEDDYIIIKETPEESFNSTIVILFLTLLFQLAPVLYRSLSSFDLRKALKQIDKEYNTNKDEHLAKVLELKRANYDRLAGVI